MSLRRRGFVYKEEEEQAGLSLTSRFSLSRY